MLFNGHPCSINPNCLGLSWHSFWPRRTTVDVSPVVTQGLLKFTGHLKSIGARIMQSKPTSHPAPLFTVETADFDTDPDKYPIEKTADQ